MATEALNIPLNKNDYAQYFSKGISYSQYMINMEVEVKSNVETHYSKYIPMNLQRSKRIAKTVKLNEEIKETLKSLTNKINWLVISEHWCGDASQILPVVNAVAEASNGMIDLRIVYRDQNPELMNAHLTNGTKSIPKIIQLDLKYNTTGIWGPRPNEAQKLVLQLRTDPLTITTYADHLHKWYADDKTLSTQRDILKLLKLAIAFCSDCITG